MDKQALWMFTVEMRMDFIERLALKLEMDHLIARTGKSADECLRGLEARIDLNERTGLETAEEAFRDDQPKLAAHATAIRDLSDALRAISKQIADEMMGRRLRQV